MSNIMAASSGSSSGCVRREIVFGIPKVCCGGASITWKISKSAKNPYRHYYRCGYADSIKLVHDGYCFKWFDDAIVNELEKVEMVLDEVGAFIGDSEWRLTNLMVVGLFLVAILSIGIMKILS